jgi:hypothetical protein
MLSALLLSNYWPEFNKTLWGPSIPRGNEHISALFQIVAIGCFEDSMLVKWPVRHYIG